MPEDFISLPSNDSINGCETEEPSEVDSRPSEVDSHLTILENKEDQITQRLSNNVQYVDVNFAPEPTDGVNGDSDMEIEDLNTLEPYESKYKLDCNNVQPDECDGQHDDSNFTARAKHLVDNLPITPVNVQPVETPAATHDFPSSNSLVLVKDVRNADNDNSSIVNHKKGHKRARLMLDDDQASCRPSVHITYHSLTKASLQKLEELLKQWSEWHAQCDSSSQGEELLESGEEIFFPALRVGTEKTSAVSFWIDDQMKMQPKDFLDGIHAPLYDRGYTLGLNSAEVLSGLEGGLKIIDDASRCFNCGSYSHSMKDCPKPRDNAAVNNARKQHKSKRNLNASLRYFQSSQGGKFDDLKPGVLSAETRQLLGLRELDPPPWLYRMRELGYPPGYLGVADELSNITIFADEIEEEQEDGEINDTNQQESSSEKARKEMTVEFPGINAPIPENGDERAWAASPSIFESSSNQSNRRSNHHLDPVERPRHHDERWPSDHRYKDHPSMVAPSFSSRYESYDYYSNSHSPRGQLSMPRSPPFGRSYSERGYGAGRSENLTSRSGNEYDLDYYSSQSWDRHRKYRW